MMPSNFVNLISRLLIFLFILGCGQKEEQAKKNTDKPLKIVVLLAPSGKGDKSYNDMALAGIDSARKNTKLDVVELLPARVDDYPNTIQRIAEDGADLIIGVGFLYMDAIATTAKKFPNLKFVLIDGKVDVSENVVSVIFRPQEASFLVGVVAGLVSKTGNVGFIAGMDIPIMQTFACGFREGVQYAAKKRGRELVVNKRFIGGTPDAFSNPARGRDIARLMYKSGVDVIYHAAGASGNGVIQAAKETNNYVIGVDTDQSYLAPEHILTSMRKRIDLAIKEAINELKQGRFSGGDKIMSLKNGGVDYVKSALATEEIWTEVEKAKQELLQGSISVCPEIP